VKYAGRRRDVVCLFVCWVAVKQIQFVAFLSICFVFRKLFLLLYLLGCGKSSSILVIVFCDLYFVIVLA
jgi:hypothetical protein